MIRILLVDDQNLVQQGIKVLLERDPGIKVIGTVKDGRSAVAAIGKLCPDVVLLDIEMPGMDGITATKYITRLAPQTKVIILSSHEDKKYLTRALMAGAKSYILKDSLMRDLRQSIISVYNGYTQIESRLLAKIFDPSNVKLSKKTVSHQLPSLVDDRSHVKETEISTIAPDLAIASKETIFPDFTPQTNTSTKVSEQTKAVVKSEKVRHPESIENQAQQECTEQDKKVASVDLCDLNQVGLTDLQTVDLSTANKSSEANRQPFPSVIAHSSQLSTLSTKKSFQAASNKNNYFQDFRKHPRVAPHWAKLDKWYQAKQIQYQPSLEWCRAKYARFQAQARPIIKEWYEKGWLANIGLVLLGLITVLIIHRMFS